MTDTVAAGAAQAMPVAGFWRRLGAWMLDMLLLVLLVGLVCWLWTEQAVALGHVGRWVGFALVLAYFGLFNSRLFGGQTPGKRLAGVRVVGADAQPVSVPRAFARQVVFAFPFYLNGAWLPPLFQQSVVLAVTVALIVFVGGFAICYLYLFNRRSRQSLHDLAARTWVIREETTGCTPLPVMWRWHWAPVAAVSLAVLAALAYLQRWSQTQPLEELDAAVLAVVAEPEVSSAHVMLQTEWGDGRERRQSLIARARVRTPDDVNADVAGRVRDRMVAAVPVAATVGTKVVVLEWGFDLGLLQWTNRHVFRYTEPVAAGGSTSE